MLITIVPEIIQNHLKKMKKELVLIINMRKWEIQIM